MMIRGGVAECRFRALNVNSDPPWSLAIVQFFGRACKEPTGGREENDSLNPLSPNIHIQILQTDLYTFPLRIS